MLWLYLDPKLDLDLEGHVVYWRESRYFAIIFWILIKLFYWSYLNAADVLKMCAEYPEDEA